MASQSPLQRITQQVRYARRLAQLARAARANGNPMTAAAMAHSAKQSLDIARTIRASI